MINQSNFLMCWIIVLQFCLVNRDIYSLFKYIHKYIHIGKAFYYCKYIIICFSSELWFYLISDLMLSIASYGLYKKGKLAFSF